MRSPGVVVAALVIAACQSPGKPTSGAESSSVPADIAAIAKLVPASMTVVSRSTADGPIVKAVGGLDNASQKPCWQALVGKITATWSFGNVRTGRTAIVLVGDLPRKDVEACVATIFSGSQVPIAVGSDAASDTAVFTLGDEAIYATWRDHMIVAGTKEAVTDVFKGPRSTYAWGPRLAKLGANSQLAMASTDPITKTLFGIDTDGYDLTLLSEKPARGLAVIHARTAADADAIAKKIVTDDIKWGTPVTPELDFALKTLVPKVTDKDVELLLEESQFAKVPREVLENVGKAILGRPAQP